MTPDQFREARDEVGLSWGPPKDPDDFPHDKAFETWQNRYLAWLLNVTDRNVRRWMKPDGFGPHPCAVRVLEWAMSEGFEIPGDEVPDLDADEFRARREELGLNREACAAILNVEPDVLATWEDERGPHPTALVILHWIGAGYVAPEP